MRQKFQPKQTVNVFRKINTVPKATKLYNNNGTFVYPIYTFSLAGNIIVYTPIQGTNRERYLNQIIYKGTMLTLAENKHFFVHLFFHGPRLFHLSTEKVRVQFVRNGHQSGYSSADTINNNINKRSNRFSIRGNYLKNIKNK